MFKKIYAKPTYGFSLVEMLMALLVASLLLAALAPVMTKRLGDNVNVSGVSGGNRLEYSRAYYEDSEWQIPRGVNLINVTAIGGGGAGGGASYGYQEFTSTTTGWKVPDGVTKLRVFMVGAGGAGASGGQGTDWAYGNIPALTNAEGEILTAGSYTFASGITPPDSYIAPVLPIKCADSNISDKWTIVSDGEAVETVESNKRFNKFPDVINVTLSKVTMCGAGGGGGTNRCGGGGSGGYLANQSLTVTNLTSNIQFAIGAPGVTCAACSNTGHYGTPCSIAGGLGGSSYGYEDGDNGANGGCNSIGYCYSMSGGGGGGATTLLNNNNLVYQIGGGGGGGGIANTTYTTTVYGGAGGKGGGTGGGAGGARGYGANKNAVACHGGKGGTNGGNGGAGGDTSAGAHGVIANSIFSSNNCNGGKPGAIHLWYSVAAVTNGLKCQYYTKSNSGAGGGAGQIWIGEINVTPGQTVNFNVGIGGAKPTKYGEDGKNGGATSIAVNGNTYSVSGGRGGTYQSDDTYINSSKGLGGGIKTTSLGNGSTYVNWTGASYGAGGANGENGKTPINGAGGGNGGSVYKFDGTLAHGGNGGGAQADGANALSTNYGAGGGGGGGVAVEGSNPGLGGSGANGYIYIEWGKANGGGGASGEIVTKTNVFVQPETILKIFVGKGGKAGTIETVKNGVTGYFGSNGENGKTSYIQGIEGSIEKVLLTAKGGLGGYAGVSAHGFGGNADGTISSSIKGETGTENYGGNGGSITEEILPLISTIDKLSGFGGCGGNGNSPNPNACYSGLFSNAQGSAANGIGNGGGGGAVKGGAAYKGGDGAPGAVIIEWSN